MSTTKTAASEAKPIDRKTKTELKREARARLNRLDPAAAATVMDEVIGKKVSNSVSGFMTFLQERAIFGLAIGFVAGSQVQVVVKQFISSLVDPLFALLMPGNQALSSRAFAVRLGGRSATFAWGALAYTLLDFLFILLTIYLVMKIFKLDHLDKKS